MTHPLLAFLLTPMQPAETPGLRRLRLTWMSLCAALLLAVPCNAMVVDHVGPLGALPALLLVLVTPGAGIVYFRARERAHARHTGGGAP